MLELFLGMFAAAFLWLAIWVARKKRAIEAARQRTLAQLGFAPCPDRKPFLDEIVCRIEGPRDLSPPTSEYSDGVWGFSYSVENPLEASLNERPVFWYTKHGRRGRDRSVSQELLFQLNRPSGEALTLFFKPSALPAGMATRWIGAAATAAWDMQSDDLSKLSIPVDLQGSNLMGALGPPGRSLYDLMDPPTLSTMQQFGDHGGTVPRCRGQWCSVESGTGRMSLNLPSLWDLIRSLP